MRSLPALLVLLSAALATACGNGPGPSSTPSPAPSAFPAEITPSASTRPSEPPVTLMSIETLGGECVTGPCDRLVNLDTDGRLNEVIPKDRTVGTVPKELVEALEIEMAQANYIQLQSRPFTGECPTAVDGQKHVFTFHVPTGDETFDSCKVAIDTNHPLFRAVAAAFAFETL